LILVDASVSLKWFLDEPDAGVAEQLSMEHPIAAPELVIGEVGNGLWKAVRKQALTAEQARAAIETLRSRFDSLFPLEPLCERALEIALLLDHPVYDCFYLAAAEREERTLITADQRLVRVVSSTPWEAICRPLSAPEEK
jgi:predicted nucleic acid-binding protein